MSNRDELQNEEDGEDGRGELFRLSQGVQIQLVSMI
jgi:hypothetical protein